MPHIEPDAAQHAAAVSGVRAWAAVAAMWLRCAAAATAAMLAGVAAVAALLAGAAVALLAAAVGVPAPGWWRRQVADAYRRAADRSRYGHQAAGSARTGDPASNGSGTDGGAAR